MNASELVNDGYYWCSHDLGWALPPGASYSEEWHVVQLLGRELQLAGADVSVRLDGLPDYVKFYGPLEHPPAVATTDWQPIETAPKDGTTILIRHGRSPDWIVHAAFYRSEEEIRELDGAFGWSMDDVGWWSYTTNSVTQELLDDYRSPTHWIPMPPTTSG